MKCFFVSGGGVGHAWTAARASASVWMILRFLRRMSSPVSGALTPSTVVDSKCDTVGPAVEAAT